MFTKAKSSSGIHNINYKEIGSTVMPLPTLEEQAELVTTHGYLLVKDAKAGEIANDALRQIELVRNSILSKALRGNLGTNNPEEHNSGELLAEVLNANE